MSLPFDPLTITLHKWTAVFMRYSMRSFILYAKENSLSISTDEKDLKMRATAEAQESELPTLERPY